MNRKIDPENPISHSCKDYILEDVLMHKHKVQSLLKSAQQLNSFRSIVATITVRESLNIFSPK